MLIVLEANVEERLVALDQARLQDKRLLGAGGDDVLDVGDLLHQAARLWLQAVRRAEVGAHAVPEGGRLAHVDHVALSVTEDIDARARRQGARLLQQLIGGCGGHRTPILSSATSRRQAVDRPAISLLHSLSVAG